MEEVEALREILFSSSLNINAVTRLLLSLRPDAMVAIEFRRIGSFA